MGRSRQWAYASFVPKAAYCRAQSRRPRLHADQVYLTRARAAIQNVDLLSELDGIVDLDAWVPTRALNLGMPKQKPDGAKEAGRR